MTANGLTESQRDALDVFERTGDAGEPLTTSEVAERLDVSRRSAYGRLERMADRDLLRTKKVGSRGRVWWRGTGREDDRGDAERTGRDDADQFQRLVEAVEEYAIFRLDPDGRVESWNPGAARLKGYEADEILGEHVSTFYTDEDRASGVPTRNLDRADAEGVAEDEGWRVRDDGSRFWATVTITAIRDDDGALEGYAKVTRDMTERKRAREKQRLQLAVSRSIAEASSLEDGLRATVEHVCEWTNWDVGQAWAPTGEGTIERLPVSYVESSDFDPFVEASRERTFGPGEGIPGRVLESGENVRVPDVSAAAEEGYPRAARAAEAGVRSGLGIPVPVDGEVAVVLEFYLSEAPERHDRSVDAITSIAAELGGLVARKQAEDALERERDLLRQVMEAAPVGISVFTPDGDVERANSQALAFHGRSAAGTDYRMIRDRSFYDEDGVSIPFEEWPFATALELGVPIRDWTARIDAPDGDRSWLSINAAPIRNDEGDVERVVTIAEDVTRLERQARRLERERDDVASELDEVFARIDDAFYAVDEEFRFTYANEQAEELLGRAGEELYGRSVWEVFPETTETDAWDAFHDALETQDATSYDAYFDSLDFWVEANVYPSDSGLSVYFRDVTDRKKRERALEESERQYRAIAEHFPNGLVTLFDDCGRFTLAAGRAFDDVPLDPTDVEGRTFREVWDGDTVDAIEPAFEAALAGEARSVDVAYAGRDWVVHTAPITDKRGDVFAGMSIAQDITERKERKQSLETRIHQQEIVADLGQRALRDRDVDVLMAEAAKLVAEALDNDYGEVLDLRDDSEELLLRQGVGWADGIVGEATVSAVADDSQAAYTLSSSEPVVVEDLAADSRFDGPELLRSHAVSSGVSVVIGPPDDPWGILGTHDAAEKAFSEHDVTFVQSVANVLATAINRQEDELALVRQREQLAALNNVNAVVRNITEAVIEQSTREEIERIVCERLANTDSYEFAWVGDVDVATQTVVRRAAAGVEGYLDDSTISVDPGDERSRGPTGRALRTGEIQTAQDVASDPQYEPWRESALEHGVRSSAAIPIVHEDSTYGVLNVYADRPHAFRGQERAVIGQLGEVVGHAIAGVERKRALMSDEVVELEFIVPEFLDGLGVDAADGTIALDETIPIADGDFLVYGHATADATDALLSLVEAVPHWEDALLRGNDGDGRFELRISDPPVLSVVASLGGSIEETVVDDGDYRMTIHLSPSADVRTVIETVRETYPRAEMVSRQQFSRPAEVVERTDRVLTEELTDRQRTALRAAYHAGFFEWPRDSSGEDVAASLDVSPPTFHQHLRKAERKVLDSLLASAD